MFKKKWFLFILLILFLFSCAQPTQLTPEEIAQLREKQIQMTQKVYCDIPPQKILEACAYLLSLADHDYKFHFGENYLIAQRNWLLYLILFASSGTDTWQIRIEKTNSGNETCSKVIVQAYTSSNTIVGTANQYAGSVATLPYGSKIIISESLYKLFFSRLDYLLGLSDKWMDCQEAQKWAKTIEKTRKINIDPLCLLGTVDDKKPEKRIVKNEL